MKNLLLIDANSLIHRAFHALPPLTAKDGTPAQALYGVSSILLKLWREERPDYAASLFDRPEPTFREKEYKEYKAQRAPAPETLVPQLIKAHNLFEAFGIKVFDAAGFEADDLIATLTEKFRNEKDLRIVILTGDRDTLQLVEDDHVIVKSFKKGVSDTLIYNDAMVREQFGLAPAQIVDYKALVGDPSDNIKGVAGIGPKKATELLQQFGTVEDIYAHLGEITGAAREKLESGREAALQSKRLVTLDRNAPAELQGLEAIKIDDAEDAVAEYFESLGFKALLARLHAHANGAAPSPQEKKKSPKSKEGSTAQEKQSTMF